MEGQLLSSYGARDSRTSNEIHACIGGGKSSNLCNGFFFALFWEKLTFLVLTLGFRV